MTIDVDHVAGQVRENCAISDAQHAGAFSICGLALRLRNLFKWERGLDPWMDRQTWKELVAAFPQSPIELLARAVKDLLADTSPQGGTLAYIVEEQRRASLGFFTAFLDGLRRELFPEMRRAFSAFLQSGDWGAVEQARQEGFRNALRCADILTSAFQRGRDQDTLDRAEAEIEQRLLKPLGISRDSMVDEENEA